MKEIDRMIRDALRDEDAEMYERFGGAQPIHEAITDLFRFRPRWLLLLIMAVNLLALAAAVYATIRFFQTEEIRGMFVWSAIFFVCVAGVTTMKIWAWVEMSKNALIREIKRLELQTAYLAGKIRGQNPEDTTE